MAASSYLDETLRTHSLIVYRQAISSFLPSESNFGSFSSTESKQNHKAWSNGIFVELSHRRAFLWAKKTVCLLEEQTSVVQILYFACTFKS